MLIPRSKYYELKEWKEQRKEFLGINTTWEICGAKATEIHHDFDYNYYYWNDIDFFNKNYWIPICKSCHSRITMDNKRLRKQDGLDY